MDLIVGTLVLKTKIILITIYTASSFLCRYFRAFLFPLVASLDYFTGDCAEVYSIPAIRCSK
jgi:hypothetical protein